MEDRNIGAYISFGHRFHAQAFSNTGDNASNIYELCHEIVLEKKFGSEKNKQAFLACVRC